MECAHIISYEERIIIYIPVSQVGPYLWISKSMDQVHICTKLIFLQTWMASFEEKSEVYRKYTRGFISPPKVKQCSLCKCKECCLQPSFCMAKHSRGHGEPSGGCSEAAQGLCQAQRQLEVRVGGNLGVIQGLLTPAVQALRCAGPSKEVRGAGGWDFLTYEYHEPTFVMFC